MRSLLTSLCNFLQFAFSPRVEYSSQQSVLKNPLYVSPQINIENNLIKVQELWEKENIIPQEAITLQIIVAHQDKTNTFMY
jgi:hypothetical protein